MAVVITMARIKMGLRDRDGVSNCPVTAAYRAKNPTHINY